MTTLPQLSLILGGVSSGKSCFAEQLAHQSGCRLHYIATADAALSDEEMRRKIKQHQEARCGAGWHSVEAPRDLPAVLGGMKAGDIALVDCLTMWLSNIMYAQDGAHEDLFAQGGAVDGLFEAVASCAGKVIVVSNEVGLGGVRGHAVARDFARLQGRLNQMAAQRAGLVVMVAAGLPMVLKGQLGGA